MNISDKLGKKEAKLQLADNVIFDVDVSADKYLEVQESIKDKDFSIDVMYIMIEKLMGEKALDYIKNQKYSLGQIRSIIIALSALVNEETYEEMEKRFPKEQ